MQITLVRHGVTAVGARRTMTGYEIGDFVREYEAIGLRPHVSPPPHLIALASRCGCIVSSDARRALESAQLLAPSKTIRREPMFREAGLPKSIDLRIPLPAGWWIALARLAWWLNVCASEESRGTASMRASLAADRLIELARQDGWVLAIGHGIFGRLVAAELRRRGWRGPRLLPRRHWSAATFVVK